ncbi:hypothetical protein BU16DRAFT_577700 [Lophium mytilinum]|uniref:F-box domain-containing protein n=1 Tax=Lophium mytilinum TaxID=390894 RepID=A0A6A6RA71_9PEZI|nr:hypothetical protein BU16DRAFT_577700 [Lophium mytilinum]
MLPDIQSLLLGAHTAPTAPDLHMPEREELEVLESSPSSTVLPSEHPQPASLAPLLSLPNELLLQVAESIPSIDLANLSLVSKRINAIGSEALFRDISFTSSDDDRVRMAQLITTLHTYPDLANLVKSITYTDLRSLKDPRREPQDHLDRWRDLEEIDPQTVQTLVDEAIAAALPYGHTFCKPSSGNAGQASYGYYQTNFWVNALRMGSLDAVLAVLLSMVPNISRLKLHFTRFGWPDLSSALAQAALLATRTPWVHDGASDLCSPLRQTFAKLKEVDIAGPQCLNHDLSDSPWMSLPSVLHIRRAGFRPGDEYTFKPAPNTDKDLSGIHTLRLSDNGDASMSRGFGKALATCKKLRSLHISESGMLNRRFMQALMTQNRTLETLVIDGRDKHGGTICKVQRTIGSLAGFRNLKHFEIAAAMLWGYDFSVEGVPDLLPRCLEELVVTDLWARVNRKKAEMRVQQILESVRAGNLPALRRFTIRHPPTDEVRLVEDIQEVEFAGSLEQKNVAKAFMDVNVDFQIIRPT